jgi:predicted RNA-binding protein Jag
MDKIEIQNLIKELLERATLPVKEISVSEEGSGTLNKDGSKTTWFSVEISQPHYFIGREGEALFALNHLVKKIIEAKAMSGAQEGIERPMIEKGPSILIDISGFQKKRIENIHAIAHMMAERARYFKSNIEVDPMSAFDRRIVHEFLSDAHDLKTESTGEGLTRRVVIKYVGSI